MEAHVPNHQAVVRAHARTVAAVLAVVSIALLTVAELAAPPALTLGTAVILPVLVSCFVLERRWALAVLGLAVLTRVGVAVVGDTTIGLAALEAVSYAGCTAIALTAGRRAQPPPDPPPLSELTPRRAEAGGSAAVLTAHGLTDRERQVLDMAIRGLTAKQIGERLYIGRRTVETHLDRARDKLGVRTKRELIAWWYDSLDRPHAGS